MRCPNCKAPEMRKREVKRRNCTRIEYRCGCGWVDFDFKNIVAGTMSGTSGTVIRHVWKPARELKGDNNG